jgi:hypothetical protein
MHRPADIDNLQDFNQYYRGSVIGLLNEKEGTYSPILITGTGGGQVAYTPDGTNTVTAPFEEVLRLGQFGSPQYGSAEVGDTCIYVSRRAARTASRGHRLQGLRAHFFHPEETRPDILSHWDYYKVLFNPRVRQPQEAWDVVSSGRRLACTLSRHFTLAQTEGYTAPCLYYRTELVGFMPTNSRIETEEEDSRLLVRDAFIGVAEVI